MLPGFELTNDMAADDVVYFSQKWKNLGVQQQVDAE